MKKLNKVLIILFTFSAGLFTGCGNFFAINDGNNDDNPYKTTVRKSFVNEETNEPVYAKYMVKYNFSENDYCFENAFKAGYIKNARTVITEENNPIFNEVNNEKYIVDGSLTHKLLEETAKLKTSTGRAAITNSPVDDNTATVGSTKYFYFYSANSYENMSAICKAIGTNCNVWFINNNVTNVKESDINFEEIKNKFDSIYDLETSILGSNKYTSKSFNNIINSVSKVDIIVADIKEKGYEGLNGGVFGYFSSGDMLSNYNNSNKTHAIYIDSFFYKKVPEKIYSTIVHEFNHLLNYCQKTVVGGMSPYKTWYTEMLSMVSEDLFHQYLEIEAMDSAQGRLKYFNTEYNYGFEVWRNSGDYVYYSYANAFAFGAFLVRNYGGVELLKKIATNSYIDRESVIKAVNEINNLNLTYQNLIETFSEVLFNYKENGDIEGKENIITLYKTAGNKNDSNKLYFTPIKLEEHYYEYKDLNNQIKRVYGPISFTNSTDTDLGVYGFSIHKIPDYTEYIELVYYTNSGVEYKFYN